MRRVQANGTNRNHRGAVPKDQEIRRPGRLDFDKATKVVTQVVRKNQEWLKEMADK